MAEQEELEKYREMRNFSRTPEPSGGKATVGPPTFVVQKHAATALHYDFRLQVGDVMPSWAVPKGPSYNPKVRRLAVQTEDHPLDYQSFEGTIPRGEYGGGEVIVWDRGTYERVSTKPGQPLDMRKSIEAGHFSVMLWGEKLIGTWSLIRTGTQQGKDQWVMVKHNDEYCDADRDIQNERPESVVSGDTIEDLKRSRETSPVIKGKAEWVEPMLAQPSKRTGLATNHTQPSDSNWIYERKLDGLRCIAVRNGDTVDLWSRNQLSFNKRFPSIIASLADLPIDNFVVDGEIVAFDSQDHTSFSLLQQDKSVHPELHLFDVMFLLGQDTRSLPLTQRKELLSKAIDDGNLIKLVAEQHGDPATLLAKACKSGWEGIVAKRADSKYVAGRSPNWLKLKCTTGQELVIGGWTEPQRSRVGFGALLLGYNDSTGFRYAGKVGTGFNAALLKSLYTTLEKDERNTSPFIDPVKEKSAHWVTPKLVASIAFTEWTNDGRLRHPAFEGLRPDKQPSEVVREQ